MLYNFDECARNSNLKIAVIGKILLFFLLMTSCSEDKNLETNRFPYILDAENAHVDSEDPAKRRAIDGRYIELQDSENDFTAYNIYIDNPQNTQVYPWIDHEVVQFDSDNQHSIGFAFRATDVEDNVRERAEVAVRTHKNENALRFNETRYFAFDLFIDEKTETPRYWTIIHQLEQMSRPGSHPPFRIVFNTAIKKTGPLELSFHARDNQYWDKKHGYYEVYKSKVVRGKWYHVICKYRPQFPSDMEPSDVKSGMIDVWMSDKPIRIDAMETPNGQYKGYWGYTPFPTLKYDKIDVRFGLYRRMQNRFIKIYFDNVIYSDNPHDVFD